jgi:hypothetical protein
MSHEFILHMVHVAATRMIEQGTDGLSRGSFLEGVAISRDMLSFVGLALSATKRHPPIMDFFKSWLETTSSGVAHVLLERQWFVEWHGIIGGRKDHHGVWMPLHTANGRSYIWAPPPVIADVALEECLKVVHKRTDAYHVFLIPRLYCPLWLCLFYKLSDFVFHVSPGSRFWSS